MLQLQPLALLLLKQVSRCILFLLTLFPPRKYTMNIKVWNSSYLFHTFPQLEVLTDYQQDSFYEDFKASLEDNFKNHLQGFFIALVHSIPP